MLQITVTEPEQASKQLEGKVLEGQTVFRCTNIWTATSN